MVVNDFDEPKHILNSKLFHINNSYEMEYFSWNLEKQLVEKWQNDKVVGYVQNVEDSEIFMPLNESKVLYLSESGEAFIKSIESSL